ncbi:hypothetical protein Bbelb_349770 [Branchiostoma belcheri]|nr:hypothetical protein Bbelb_349770 [Branchiostoma belcheri]
MPKHVGLGVSVRHMTGSKQLVQMLNRLGHCCSYDEVEVIDTSLAMEVIAKSENYGVVIPTNISPGAFIQVAADNNDFKEETLDGKKTTHATTIVVYQKQQFGPKPKPVVHADHSEKRRSFVVDKSTDVLEFGVRKRPDVTQYKDQVKNEWFQYNTSLRSINLHKDLGWILMRMGRTLAGREGELLEDQTIPSWSAFNMIMSNEPPPQTKVGYCPLIDASSAEYSTVYTVMKQTKTMMAALGQENSVITMDLAMYVKAKTIQWCRPEEFKSTIIRLGGFHIALKYLSVIGKLFKDSGIQDVLIESEVYDPNTAQALLDGKSYNRGVRAHKLLCEALLRLQWQAFIAWLPTERNEQLIESISECIEISDDEALKTSYTKLCQKMPALLQPEYEKFRRQYHERSKLFRFWDLYIEAVLLLLRFIRAEREGSWHLHLNAVAEMIPYFFALDRINYARWLSVYLADMQMLPSCAPDVHQQFVDGNHAVCRSQQPFSQVWTDMALEQTINCDSKARGGGIIGITQKESARDRWFVTSHERAAITSATKLLCNLDNAAKVGTHKEAGFKRIKNDEADVQKISNTIITNMKNPFDVVAQAHEGQFPLCNIATGVAMPDDQAVRLLNCLEIGAVERDKFVDGRMKTGGCFWNKITKVKVKTFSALTKVKNIKCSDEKVITISADRNLFGRLLVAAKYREIHLKDVLCYELSTVPYALAHADGSLRKNAKSVLMGELEKECPPEERLPSDDLPTAHIVDGMALVQMMKTANCSTFGDLATKYLEVVCTPLKRRTCIRVDVVFDRYDQPLSIKENERQRRGSSEALEIQINNRNFPVPKQWAKFISNKTNKANLTDFLCNEWISLAPAHLSPGQELIIGGGFSDATKAVRITSNGCNVRVEELICDHEEADTRMILHACQASASMQRIIIQSPDTDVAVLATYTFSMMQCQELWFKTGVRDNVRFIPLHTLSKNLGSSLCAALPGFHALTGCDSTSALFMVGRRKLGGSYERILLSLATSEILCLSLLVSGSNAGHTADAVRYYMFCQRRQSSEALPPTSNSLFHHIERANFQTFVWKRCVQAMQELPSPVNNGWRAVDNVLEPVLMSCDPAPASLLQLTTCRCTSRSACKRDDRCPCNGHEMPCTESCHCMNDDECQNPYRQSTTEVLDENDDELSETEDVGKPTISPPHTPHHPPPPNSGSFLGMLQDNAEPEAWGQQQQDSVSSCLGSGLTTLYGPPYYDGRREGTPSNPAAAASKAPIPAAASKAPIPAAASKAPIPAAASKAPIPADASKAPIPAAASKAPIPAAASKAPIPAAASKAPIPAVASKAPIPAAASKAPIPAAASKAPIPADASKAPIPAAPASKAPIPADASKAPIPADASKAPIPADATDQFQSSWQDDRRTAPLKDSKGMCT